MILLKKIYRFTKNYLHFYKLSKPYNIKVFNAQWGSNVIVSDHWLFKFIDKLDLSSSGFITIFSVNGSRKIIDLVKSKYKIFYTAENVHVPLSHWQKYEDLLINKRNIDLSLGFDYIEHQKYLRFPLWLMYNFKPNSSITDVHSYIAATNVFNRSNANRLKFCAFICRYDYFGDRAKFADLITQIENINYPGNFRHNDESLKLEYDDDKIEYLKQFKFNLCPENSNAEGYVTEKIFDAIKAGCIPIYWGSNNRPETDVLNQNRILFLSLDGDNTEVLNKIKLLNENETAYDDFYKQPVFTPNAPEVIYGYFERLEKKIRQIVE